MTDPLDSLTTDPATGRNAYALQGIAYEMMRHHLVQHLVDLVRDEFDLTDPLDDDALARNRHIPRATVRARVLEIAADTLWTGDLQALNFLFHAEETPAEFADQLSQLVPSQLPDAVTPPIPQIAGPLIDSGLLDTFRDIAVDMLTDRVIEGELSLPQPLPSSFAHSILTFPLEGDTVIVALVTRFADIQEVIDDLRAKHAQLFVPGDRATHPHNADRDTWILIQYHNIKDAGTTDDVTIYDQLLTRFEASRWKDDIAHDDLDTREGQTAAKDFLRNIIRNQRKRWRQIMNSVDHPPDDPV